MKVVDLTYGEKPGLNEHYWLKHVFADGDSLWILGKTKREALKNYRATFGEPTKAIERVWIIK